MGMVVEVVVVVVEVVVVVVVAVEVVVMVVVVVKPASLTTRGRRQTCHVSKTRSTCAVVVGESAKKRNKAARSGESFIAECREGMRLR